MTLTFEANLPTDAQMPVKPTKDFDPKTLKRRVRVWLDAYLSPGDTEKLLLLADGTFIVTLNSDELHVARVGYGEKATGSTLGSEVNPDVPFSDGPEGDLDSAS